MDILRDLFRSGLGLSRVIDRISRPDLKHLVPLDWVKGAYDDVEKERKKAEAKEGERRAGSGSTRPWASLRFALEAFFVLGSSLGLAAAYWRNGDHSKGDTVAKRVGEHLLQLAIDRTANRQQIPADFRTARYWQRLWPGEAPAAREASRILGSLNWSHPVTSAQMMRAVQRLYPQHLPTVIAIRLDPERLRIFVLTRDGEIDLLGESGAAFMARHHLERRSQWYAERPLFGDTVWTLTNSQTNVTAEIVLGANANPEVALEQINALAAGTSFGAPTPDKGDVLWSGAERLRRHNLAQNSAIRTKRAPRVFIDRLASASVHSKNWRRGLREVVRVLAVGGELIYSVPENNQAHSRALRASLYSMGFFCPDRLSWVTVEGGTRIRHYRMAVYPPPLAAMHWTAVSTTEVLKTSHELTLDVVLRVFQNYYPANYWTYRSLSVQGPSGELFNTFERSFLNLFRHRGAFPLHASQFNEAVELARLPHAQFEDRVMPLLRSRWPQLISLQQLLDEMGDKSGKGLQRYVFSLFSDPPTDPTITLVMSEILHRWWSMDARGDRGPGPNISNSTGLQPSARDAKRNFPTTPVIALFALADLFGASDGQSELNAGIGLAFLAVRISRILTAQGLSLLSPGLHSSHSPFLRRLAQAA
jgi:hypothetical protein